MPNIGPTELIIVLVVALLVLGPKRLPEAGRAMGKGLREFKASLGGPLREAEDEYEDPPALETSMAGRLDRRGSFGPR